MATTDRPIGYTPSPWEKITVVAVSVGIVLLVGWLVVRNQKFADPNLVVILRIILSLAVAVLGATIPGFLQVDWKGRGVAIRAGGALALFVMTFLLSPKVVHEKSSDQNTQETTVPRLDREISQRLATFRDYLKRSEAEQAFELRTIWLNKALNEIAPTPEGLVTGEKARGPISLHKIYAEYKERDLPALLVELESLVPADQKSTVTEALNVARKLTALDFRAKFAGPTFPSEEELRKAHVYVRSLSDILNQSRWAAD